MARNAPSILHTSDIEAEIEHLQEHFDECAKIGQGISTKDGVRMRQLREELATRPATVTA